MIRDLSGNITKEGAWSSGYPIRVLSEGQRTLVGNDPNGKNVGPISFAKLFSSG